MTLAKRAAGGDAAAFQMLVDRHAPALFRTCYSLSATRSDAEDLLQETFVGAFGGLKRFNGSSSVKTWLTSILMRQAAKAWHRNRHHRKTRSIDNGPADSNGHTMTPTSATVSDSGTGKGMGSGSGWGGSGQTAQPIHRVGHPAGTAEQLSDLKADLETILKKIDPAHREILVLRELQQMTYDQIAQTLDLPRGTVESRLFRARAELRRRMKDYQ